MASLHNDGIMKLTRIPYNITAAPYPHKGGIVQVLFPFFLRHTCIPIRGEGGIVHVIYLHLLY